MKLRPALPLDAPRLAFIEAAQPMSAHWGEKGLAGEIGNASACVWCWEENGAVLGFLSLFSCFFFDHPAKELPLFIAIAAVIGLTQLPFIMIQRYNRPRLKRLAKRLEQP